MRGQIEMQSPTHAESDKAKLLKAQLRKVPASVRADWSSASWFRTSITSLSSSARRSRSPSSCFERTDERPVREKIEERPIDEAVLGTSPLEDRAPAAQGVPRRSLIRASLGDPRELKLIGSNLSEDTSRPRSRWVIVSLSIWRCLLHALSDCIATI
mmetsp:Transcript_110799/g.196294  ORF Transcript_110799/g.196294 Transcript_110799/m.196294 type:complete len:157 (+) Transcript_110799:39-509(+)